MDAGGSDSAGRARRRAGIRALLPARRPGTTLQSSSIPWLQERLEAVQDRRKWAAMRARTKSDLARGVIDLLLGVAGLRRSAHRTRIRVRGRAS